jgi:hypothetical protein
LADQAVKDFFGAVHGLNTLTMHGGWPPSDEDGLRREADWLIRWVDFIAAYWNIA